MKKVFLVAVLFSLSFVSCEEDFWDRNAAGLKEALTIGAKNATNILGEEDGYLLGGDGITIPLPAEAQTALNTLKSIQGVRSSIVDIPLIGSMVKDYIPDLSPNMDEIIFTAINRAAEDAAPQSVDIFVNAIKDMSISNASSILFSDNNYAATDYLRATTSSDLQTAFSPVIDDSLETVSVGDYTANSAWRLFAEQNNNLANYLNSNSLVKNAVAMIVPAAANINVVSETLGGYVVEKALDGLFKKVEGEELKIRTDVNARTSDLLQDVFGQLDNR